MVIYLKRVWIEKDVSYDYLRVFNSKAFVNVLKDERSKFNYKTEPYIFIWYNYEKFEL